MDFEIRRMIVNNKMIWFTNTENILLKLLYTKKGNVITYEKMANELYQTECDKWIKSLIRRHILLLRRKIGNYIKIKTIRDIGYIIEEA